MALDIAIFGAGITGLSSALALVKQLTDLGVSLAIHRTPRLSG